MCLGECLVSVWVSVRLLFVWAKLETLLDR